MSEYPYKSDFERELTQQYEGTYTPEEIELNNALLEACSSETVDFAKVEQLLQKGADPLGGTAISGCDLLDHIYGEIVADSSFQNSVNLPKITELFLKYGMNIDAPRIPYDEYNEWSINPLWDFAFATNENSILALKMLLDHGLSADSFTEFADHAILDLFNCSCGDPQNDPFWNNACTWTLKMILLGASYDHVYLHDDYCANFICADYNINDVHIFRNWNNFEYFYDTTHCEKVPELYGSIVHIYDKATKKEVWRIGFE